MLTMPINARVIVMLLSVGFVLWMMCENEPAGTDAAFGESSTGWKKIVAMKKHENMAKIPTKWRLPMETLIEGKKRKKIAGDYIESLLDADTQKITSSDNDEILESVRNGSLTAVQVTQAFCKRGAYAHQLVSKAFSPIPC